jgi:hypothetical protein
MLQRHLLANDTNSSTNADNEDVLKKKKRIHTIVKELPTWFHANCYVINFKKTTAMPFHIWQNRSLLKPQITFNNMYIKCK